MSSVWGVLVHGAEGRESQCRHDAGYNRQNPVLDLTNPVLPEGGRGPSSTVYQESLDLQ